MDCLIRNPNQESCSQMALIQYTNTEFIPNAKASFSAFPMPLSISLFKAYLEVKDKTRCS